MLRKLFTNWRESLPFHPWWGLSRKRGGAMPIRPTKHARNPESKSNQTHSYEINVKTTKFSLPMKYLVDSN